MLLDDVGLNIARPQPAREPEPVAASLKGDDHTLDAAPRLAGFAAPTMQELQQRFLVGVEFLKWLAFDAGNERRDQPLRLAHLKDTDITLRISIPLRRSIIASTPGWD